MSIAETSKTARHSMSVVGSAKDEPKEKVEDNGRVSTGISSLDQIIGGGLPAGKSYLVVGEAAAGKTIFCAHFVLKSLMDGEKVVYVPVDEKPSEIVDNAASLGWDFRSYVNSGQLLMLDVAPTLNAPTGSRGGREVDVAKVVSDLASYVKRSGATRLVIDPVAPLIAARDPTKASNETARILVRSLQDNLGTTNLLTLNFASQYKWSVDWENYPVNGVILLRFQRNGYSLIRTLLVCKMRATAIDLTERQFAIVKEKGVVISPMPVVHEPVPMVHETAPPALSAQEEGAAPMEPPLVEQILFKEWKGK